MTPAMIACAIASLACVVVCVALIGVEMVFTKPLDRPTPILWVALAFDAFALIPCGVLAVLA